MNDTKNRISMEAEKLFAKKGYVSTSLEDIMIASKASKGSIYHHFKSKDELFIFIIKRQSSIWKTTWEEKVKDYHSAEEKLYGLTEHYISDFNNPLTVATQEFFMNTKPNTEKYKALVEFYQNEFNCLYKEIFEEGIHAGEFIPESAENYMYTFLGIHIGLSQTHSYENMTSNSMYDRYMFATKIFLRGIKA